jgi:DNA-binding NarL/FixJ family response regulator
MGRAAIVAAHNVLGRAGLVRILAAEEFDVVASCGNADELVQLTGRYQPQLVVIEGRLAPTRTDEQFRASLEIRNRWPEVGVLIIGRRAELALGGQMVAAGTDRIGWLLKDRISSVEQFLSTARTVADGGTVLDPKLVSQLLARGHGTDGVGRLSPREREVLGLIAKGRSNQAIAGKLVITQRAVEKHVASIFDKLGLPESVDDHRRVLAALRYLNVEPVRRTEPSPGASANDAKASKPS